MKGIVDTIANVILSPPQAGEGSRDFSSSRPSGTPQNDRENQDFHMALTKISLDKIQGNPLISAFLGPGHNDPYGLAASHRFIDGDVPIDGVSAMSLGWIVIRVIPLQRMI